MKGEGYAMADAAPSELSLLRVLMKHSWVARASGARRGFLRLGVIL